MKIKLETEAKLFIQLQIKKGIYDLVWSYVLDFEKQQNPYDDKRNAIQIWKSRAKTICNSSNEILELGKNIMMNGIMSKDALHIACSIKSKCDYFITTDVKLLKKEISGIQIIDPINFIREME